MRDVGALSIGVGTVRGPHFQRRPASQGERVRAIEGSIFDVAIDTGGDSPISGQHVSPTLTAEAGDQLWVPPGFVHG